MQKQIDNNSRKHAYAFKYLENGHIHTALEYEAFAKLVHSWIKLGHDCYILHYTPIKVVSGCFSNMIPCKYLTGMMKSKRLLTSIMMRIMIVLRMAAMRMHWLRIPSSQ